MAGQADATSSSCLSEAEILTIASGDLKEPYLSHARSHLDNCPECRELLGFVSRECLLANTPEAISPTDSCRINQHRYVLDKEISCGGMGRIFVAFDRVLGMQVALKSPREGRHNAERFINEMRVMGDLQHPAIMPIRDAGWLGDDFPFFAMPLVDGARLDEVVRNSTREERLRLLRNVSSIVDAVAYAHSQGILHLDVKPQNILIGRFGESILIDWGLGRRVRPGPREKPGAAEMLARQLGLKDAAGTPGYAAPEQLVGDKVDERADVYSLGMVLYHVLVGRPPVLAKPGEATRPLWAGTPALPPDLARVVERAIAPNPKDRYARVQDLSDDLRRFQSGLLVSAYPYSKVEKMRRLIRRHRSAFSVAALAFLTVGAVLGVSMRSIMQERDLTKKARDREVLERRATVDLGLSLLTDFNYRIRVQSRIDIIDELTSAIVKYLNAVPKVEDDGRVMDTARQLEMRARIHILKAELERLRGAPAGTDENLERGISVLARVLELPLEADEKDRIRQLIARARLNRGRALQVKGELPRAALVLLQVVEVAEQKLAGAADDQWLDTYVAAAASLASAESMLGEKARAKARLHGVIERLEALHAEGYPMDEDWFQACRLNHRTNLGNKELRDGRIGVALELQGLAVELYEEHVRLRAPPQFQVGLYLPIGLLNLARAESKAGLDEEAARHIRRAAEVVARAREADPEQIDLLDLQARVLSEEVRLGLRAGDLVRAQGHVVSLRRRVASRRPGSRPSHWSLARDLEFLVGVLPNHGAAYRKACRDWQAALTRLEELGAASAQIAKQRKKIPKDCSLPELVLGGRP